MNIRNFIAKSTRPYRMWVRSVIEMKRRKTAAKEFESNLKSTVGHKRIIYLGITQHKNLGDLAQFYCISRWIKKYCNDYLLIMLDAPTLVTNETNALKHLIKYYQSDDIIIYQSGYTTQDLGGDHDLMHRMVAEVLPNAKYLMMPQTIYFQHKENQQRTANSLNACHNMVFLARDFTSYETAKQMFPDIRVMPYPDIVTSLIGSFKFNNQRDKIFSVSTE